MLSGVSALENKTTSLKFLLYTLPPFHFLPSDPFLSLLFLPYISLCLAYLKSRNLCANQRGYDLQPVQRCQEVRRNLFKFSSDHLMRVKTERCVLLIWGSGWLGFVYSKFNDDRSHWRGTVCVLKCTNKVRNFLGQAERREIVFVE